MLNKLLKIMVNANFVAILVAAIFVLGTMAYLSTWENDACPTCSKPMSQRHTGVMYCRSCTPEMRLIQ